MPLIGLNNGMVPILAYNYGAGKRSRMIQTIKWSMIYGFGLLFTGFVVFEVFTPQLLLIFDASADMLEIGVPALRIIGTHFLVAWFCIVVGSVFQAVGNGVYSMIVSIARQLVVLIPAAYILAKIGGLAAVWWSFPIAEIMSLIMSTIFFVLTYKKVISKVPDNQ